MRALVLLAVCAWTLQAQSVHFGLKGGVPLNDLVEGRANFRSDVKNFTIGPMVDIFLPLGLGVEANALYKRTGYVVDPTGVSPAESHSASSWEFPLLAKYRLPGEALRPYAAMGFSFRRIGDMARIFENGSKGFVLGGGLLLDLKLIKISPELRYTRWNNDVFNAPTGNTGIRSVRNQTEFLVGFTF